MAKVIRRRMPPAERIAEILEAARRLVLRDGLSKLTMEKVGLEAGASKALVYSYFSNLTALLQQVYKLEHTRLYQQHLEGLAAPHSFQEMVKITARISRAGKNEASILVKRLSADPEIKKAIKREDKRGQAVVVDFLSQQICHYFDMPTETAVRATKLALRYDAEDTNLTNAEAEKLDEVWATMMTGAMNALVEKFGTTPNPSQKQDETDD